MIEVEPGEDSGRIVKKLQENSQCPLDSQIRYQSGKRLVAGWNEVEASEEEETVPWKAGGVYLITGGAGGLGLIFAKEIAKKAKGVALILAGRTPLGEDRQARLEELEALGARIAYKQVDVSDRQAVTDLIQSIRNEFGSLNGIIHAAGVIKDNFIIKKTKEEFMSVLAPKVLGAVNLDEASKDQSLDFFILFSSLAGVMGNAGQADYAAANAFMDAYAGYRNELAGSQQRCGRTLSLNWPLWKEGGMRVDAEIERIMRQSTGMVAMETGSGIRALYRGLGSSQVQMAVMEGNAAQMKQKLLLVAPAQPQPKKTPAASETTTGIDKGSLLIKLQSALELTVSKLLKAKVQDIDADTELSEYGFDSLTFTQFTNKLNQEYGFKLTPTIFFEYPTIHSFAEYLIQEHKGVFAAQAKSVTHIYATEDEVEEVPILKKRRARFAEAAVETVSMPGPTASEPIAVVGMSGVFPKSRDVHEFWRNLIEGQDCIMEIPNDRWNWQEYYGDPLTEINKTNIKWGGFIDGVAEFDPLFFGISPREAELMDPQQRLLMTYVWKAIEDAGYAAESLSGSQTAIFAATTGTGYNALISQANVPIEGYSSTGIVPSVGPNRMSYFLNIHGPSEPIETACSSSLVAIHRAVVAIQNGDCDMAIAGGVNTIVTPENYISFNKAGMLCEDGRCKTFSNKANGYVRGEGVGMLFLKKLKDAEEAGDNIYGIIKGTAENHGGRATSLTAPNPKAQAELLIAAYTKAGIDPRTVTYIEAHGTGTELGDPIEINGLKAAFKELYQTTGDSNVISTHCGLGSVKSNIGHLELAAGIAGVIKVLLQMKHKTLVKSLHCDTVNPYIQLQDSPFYIVKETKEWKFLQDTKGQNLPRRAGVSSFGFGGSNAHVVIEEYVPKQKRPQFQVTNGNSAVIVLSARNADRLHEQVEQLLSAIQTQRFSDTDLADIAYTLQVGREAMEERLAVIAGSIKELEEKLQGCLEGRDDIPDLYRGQVSRNKETLTAFTTDEDMQKATDVWVEKGKLAKLVNLWVKGLGFDWNKLYGKNKPCRISLPTYPFARERYWVSGIVGSPTTALPAAAFIHPLLHQNTSDLCEQRFTSTFTGWEFFLADHIVQGRRLLPGAASLEMARAAVEQAAGALKEEKAWICLKNITWVRPVEVGKQPVRVHIGLYPEETGRIAYEIYSEPKEASEERIVHSQGVAVLATAPETPGLNLSALQAQCNPSSLSSLQYYEAFKAMGFDYGPAHQGLEQVYLGQNQVLAKLILPPSVVATKDQFVLHPSLVDSAQQASMCLMMNDGEIMPYNSDTPRKPALPFALEELEVFGSCLFAMWALVRRNEGSQAGDRLQKLDIDLCDEDGKVCVRMKGFTARVPDGESGSTESSPTLGTLEVDSIPCEITKPKEKVSVSEDSIREEALNLVKKIVAKAVGLTQERINLETQFEKYGIDSIMQMNIIRELEKVTGELSKTLLFEYSNTLELVDYLVENHSEKLFSPISQEKQNIFIDTNVTVLPHINKQSRFVKLQVTDHILQKEELGNDIAIIGISGRYPLSNTLEELWEHLKAGRNCITEAPDKRWSTSLAQVLSGEQLRHQDKKYYGGFLDNINRFDHHLFEIAQNQVMELSPEIRLFLEIVWETFEDAGYTKLAVQELQARYQKGVGVFVGTMYSQYPWSIPSLELALLNSNGTDWQIANRTSHFFNLTGPSISINSACSSSLTAIHLACESLKQNTCSMAIAGGVNLTMDPSKYDSLQRTRFLGSSNQSKSFGTGDGYIPGEGVGAVLLKPLSLAIQDHDRIDAVIKSSFINHSGGRQVYTAPDPKQQAQLILNSIQRAGIDPLTISYVESAANGSELGDPIELIALANAFSQHTSKKQYCAIGSVKSNLGHLEAASGISQLSKVLLQLKHKTLVPSINANPRNPNIKLENTPFYLQETIEPWNQLKDFKTGESLPRRSMINSFGAGGAYTNLIVEEFIKEASVQVPGISSRQEYLIIFTARTEWSLMKYLEEMQVFLAKNLHLEIEDIERSLHITNHNLEHRVAIVVSSITELLEKLNFLQTGQGLTDPGIYTSIDISSDTSCLDSTMIQQALEKKNLRKVAQYWVKGLEVDFKQLNHNSEIPLIKLPKYAFDHNINFAFDHNDSAIYSEMSEINKDYEDIIQKILRGDISEDQFKNSIMDIGG
ncbi:SDR family NAD(P)-dependent oxidoreductase [Ruminiclostridium papyrosolvens]|nr:SDR family NAD(P)-dependent oxidoreductase [Ruminiclostridium papyrosolvens]